MPAVLTVLGSLNIDFVVSVERLPAPGETILGRDFQMLPGGKGANQACAAGRLGPSITTRMVGRVGNDVFGDHLKASLSAAGVDVSGVHAKRSEPTGVALIWVDRGGQNSIVVAPGANHAITVAETESLRGTFRGARFALFQLETPLDVVAAAVKIAVSEGVRTILDPAPARRLDRDLLALIEILTPNEIEASILLGLEPGRVTVEAAPSLARRVLDLGPRSVILKLGDQGCYYADRETSTFSPAFSVIARDATAAGDVFNGALAVALAEGRTIPEALRFANAAAAISVTRLGAQSSIPARSEVDAFLSTAS